MPLSPQTLQTSVMQKLEEIREEVSMGDMYRKEAT